MKRLMSAFLLFFVAMSVCADVSIRLEEDQVELGQSFSLTLNLDGADVDAIPDLSVLQKDFTVVGSEHNIRYEVINGKAQSSGEWTILLIAKHSGQLTIPAIPLGKSATAPASIEVVTAGASPRQTKNTNDADAIEDIMVKTQVSEQNPYINQQVILTVKLYNSRQLMDASYEPPRVSNALMVSLGQEKRYQSMINGRNYVIEEQQFALFPQNSGELKIQPPSFTALVYDLQPSRVHIQAKPITLNVKPVPNDYQFKDWLPAKNLILSDTFDQNTSALPEGSTLVRTITLEATGLPAELLPELDFGNPDTYKVYPEKSEGTNQSRQGNLVGSTQTKVTYFLNQSGLITVPAVKVPWFNVKTGKIAMAELPAFTINVGAVKKNKTTLPSIPASLEKKPVLAHEEEQAPGSIEAMNLADHWLWWLAGGFAILWLMTLTAWICQRRRAIQGVETKTPYHYNDLRKACAGNDAIMARDMLLAWAAGRWPENKPGNLGELETLISTKRFKEQLECLSNYLYNKDSQNKGWQGAALWDAFVEYVNKREERVVIKNKLPPLNP